MQNRFEKLTTLGRDIWEKIKMVVHFGLVCHVKKHFANISAKGGPFFKPNFAFKPRNWDGRFECHKKYRWSFWISENFAREPKKLPQNPKIARVSLMGRLLNGYIDEHFLYYTQGNI